jgi:hypothetical protein
MSRVIGNNGPSRGPGAALSLALLAVAFGASVGPPVADSQALLRSDSQDAASGPPELWIDDARIPEGDSGSQVCMFTLHLSEAVSETVTVDVGTFDSTATAAGLDYDPVSLQVTFAPGSTAESLAVHVLGDTRYERDEWFGVRLSEPVQAVLRDGEASGTIVNDDLVMISVADTSVAEGDSGTRPLAFRVRLAQPVDAPVPFSFHTLDGTATVADLDYFSVSGDTAFEAGQDQVVIAVPVIGDPILEGNEALTLRIQSAQGAASIEQTGFGTILNDERTAFEGFGCSVAPFNFKTTTLPPAWGDLDGDGRPDLPLYLASGDAYVEMPGVRSLLGDGNYHGAAWCDYDRDGDMDFVQLPYNETSSPYNFVHLFENTPSGLQDVAPAAGMDTFGNGETPTWGDFNADGWPDLFLPFYAHEAPFRSYFYLNLGNGQFQECADSAGVALRGLPLPLRPEGVAVADMNGDGTLDLYCAHHLFTNDGHAHFTDVRAQVGLPVVFDEGAQFVDYDNDGDLDLYLRTAGGPTLYQNTNGTFTDTTSTLGIGPLGWEWGDRWADVDNDGDMDLVFYPPGAIARLLLNRGDGTFEEDTSFAGVLPNFDLCSFADMDGDGDLDIAAGAYGRRFARNHLEHVARARTSFLRVRVEDDDGRLVEHGATVRLRSLDDPRHPVQTRIVDGGSGYLGQDEYTVTFGGVGTGSYDLEVSFPTTPDVPKVIGPAQNPLLGGIHAGDFGAELVVVRPSGQVTIQNRDPGTAGVEPPRSGPLPDLRAAAPNPARRMTRLDFSSPLSDDGVTLTIHDLSGRNVRTLVRNGRGADGAGAAWDLRDDEGRDVPAGLYLARLVRRDGRASVRRVIVLR